jgi:predicted glycosyltransferase
MTFKTIWIDLDNSPHVPFFKPIIEELEKRHYKVFLTARDCSQTCGLADLHKLAYRRIGRHYGKNRIMKVIGTIIRAYQLTRAAGAKGSRLAVSHGSRAQMIAARILRIPSFTIDDYEHSASFIRPEWLMMPEVISTHLYKVDSKRILKYPGIKEDVYVPTFQPDPRIRGSLGIREEEVLVTIRPPATEAHYHNPESEKLFSAAVRLVGKMDEARMVILPRYDVQKEMIINDWSQWYKDGKIIIPEHVVDGLNLLWHSDVIVSGGGTMNREAAALGVPVYSIFRGPLGAVDRYLIEKGRLSLLQSMDDVESKLTIRKRDMTRGLRQTNPAALKTIIAGIMMALESS